MWPGSALLQPSPWRGQASAQAQIGGRVGSPPYLCFPTLLSTGVGMTRNPLPTLVLPALHWLLGAALPTSCLSQPAELFTWHGAVFSWTTSHPFGVLLSHLWLQPGASIHAVNGPAAEAPPPWLAQPGPPLPFPQPISVTWPRTGPSPHSAACLAHSPCQAQHCKHRLQPVTKPHSSPPTRQGLGTKMGSKSPRAGTAHFHLLSLKVLPSGTGRVVAWVCFGLCMCVHTRMSVCMTCSHVSCVQHFVFNTTSIAL